MNAQIPRTSQIQRGKIVQGTEKSQKSSCFIQLNLIKSCRCTVLYGNRIPFFVVFHLKFSTVISNDGIAQLYQSD